MTVVWWCRRWLKQKGVARGCTRMQREGPQQACKPQFCGKTRIGYVCIRMGLFTFSFVYWPLRLRQNGSNRVPMGLELKG